MSPSMQNDVGKSWQQAGYEACCRKCQRKLAAAFQVPEAYTDDPVAAFKHCVSACAKAQHEAEKIA